MKKIQYAAIFTAITALGYNTTARAQLCCAPMGWYAEANAGTTRITDITYPAGVTSKKSNFGWNVNLGYKVMSFLAIEAGYTRYNPSSLYGPANTRFAQNYFYVWDGAVKAILPVGCSGFNVFAKAGAAQIRSYSKVKDSTIASTTGLTKSTTHTKVGPYYGAGIEWFFIPSFGVNAQWARAKGDSSTGTLDLYSIGLSYLFG